MNLIQKKYPNESERNYENFKASLAHVNIFYSELKETVINQEAKTSWTDLISNIGGILGLFLRN